MKAAPPPPPATALLHRIMQGYEPPVTLTELADYCGCSLGHLSRVLAGERPAGLALIKAVARFTRGRVDVLDWEQPEEDTPCATS